MTGALALGGCADFPDLGAAVSSRAQNAPYPRILPLDQLLAAAPPHMSDSGLGPLPGRLARLRHQARILRSRPVIDRASRARLQAALARHR